MSEPRRERATAGDTRLRKDLGDLDRTDGGQFEHYSREDVLAACHATGGGGHE